MTHEKFAEVLRELESQGTETLITKNAKYSSSDDALHNFKQGGEIGGCTPAQACWGYMTKHLVALRDKVQRNDFSDKEDLLEKTQDIINYVKFIWAIGNEDEEDTKVDSVQFEEWTGEEPDGCSNCIYNDYGNLDNSIYPCNKCKFTICPTEPEYKTRPLYYHPEN